MVWLGLEFTEGLEQFERNREVSLYRQVDRERGL